MIEPNSRKVECPECLVESTLPYRAYRSYRANITYRAYIIYITF